MSTRDLVVFSCERAASDSVHAQDWKILAGYKLDFSLDRLRSLRGPCDVHGCRSVSGSKNAGERFGTIAKLLEERVREVIPFSALSEKVNSHELFWTLDRQHLDEDSIDQAEDCSVCADGNRKREYHNRRVTGTTS